MAGVRAWISAFRLRTLPLAFSSIIMGTALAYEQGYFSPLLFGLTLLTTLFLQILSNLANDFGDSVSGVDGDHRQGPVRMVQQGSISKTAMKRSLFVFGTLSFLSGLVLLVVAFQGYWMYLLIFLLIGLLAIFAAINYTVGARPYGYVGLGDLFVYLFFGLAGVLGTCFLFTKQLDLLLWLPASTSGFLAVGVLNINNIRDIESDRKSGKFSIPVRVGRKVAIAYHRVLLVAALVAMALFMMLQNVYSGGWLFLLSLPLLLINFVLIGKKEGLDIDPLLRQLALCSLLLSVFFAFGLVFF